MKLLGISGSLRKASVNTALLREAARVCEPSEFTLANLHLPLYDGDLETAEGLPASVQLLSDQIAAADAVVIATPEYNKALSGVLKNALDWISRTDGAPLRDKPVAIMSATAGRTGGERAQASLRLALLAFRPNLLQGPDVLVAAASKEFDENGHLTSDMYAKQLAELMERLRAAAS